MYRREDGKAVRKRKLNFNPEPAPRQQLNELLPKLYLIKKILVVIGISLPILE